MASFGRVLDLFDHRYMNPLEDIMGNVEALPTLIPYEQYNTNIQVYRMDVEHDIFLAMLHEHTNDKARETRKEIWTWFIQWQFDERFKVPNSDKEASEDESEEADNEPAHKKARLDPAQDVKKHNAQPPHSPQAPQPQKPIIDTCERRILDQEILREDDMLRALVDIVQAYSTHVPNYVEFLYRYIDYYTEDGTALKAALTWEIPSLWDFPEHPIAMTEFLKRRIAESKRLRSLPPDSSETQLVGTDDNADLEGIGDMEHSMRGLPTEEKSGKPSIAVLEAQVDLSERLKYHEVKYGIQPPKIEPEPPLHNVPRDDIKRHQYYHACFRSRHRALVLLLEAGITLQQVNNYVRSQTASVRDTPHDDPDNTNRLVNYYKDAACSQKFHELKALFNQMHEKRKEVALSAQIAMEAQSGRQRTASGATDGPAASVGCKDTTAEHYAKLKAKFQEGEKGKGRSDVLPSSFMKKSSTRRLANRIDRKGFFKRQWKLYLALPKEIQDQVGYPNWRNTDYDDNNDGSRNGNDESDSDDDSDSSSNQAPTGFSASGQAQPPAPPMLLPLPPMPAVPALPQLPQTSSSASSTANAASQTQPGAAVPSDAITSEMITNFFENMTPEQAQKYIPMLNQHLVATMQAEAEAEAAAGNEAAHIGASNPTGSQASAFGGLQQTGPQGPVQSSAGPSQAGPSSAPGLQRNAPAPLNLAAAASPFSTLGAEILATTPFLGGPGTEFPIMIYLPKVIMPGNGIGPGGLRLGRDGAAETDALLLGHTQPGSGKILLDKAVLLSFDYWPKILRNLTSGKYQQLESYMHATRKAAMRAHYGNRGQHPDEFDCSHWFAVRKLEMAMGIMRCMTERAGNRETGHTKRWRASRGPLTDRDRGAIWEGWGALMDRPIVMTKENRYDAKHGNGWIDGTEKTTGAKPLDARRRKEIDELLEMESSWDTDDDMYEM